MTQLELQKETPAEPYVMFEYTIRSPYTKESDFRRLRRFFDAISLEGPTFDSRCNLFAERGKQDPTWTFNCILTSRVSTYCISDAVKFIKCFIFYSNKKNLLGNKFGSSYCAAIISKLSKSHIWFRTVQ